MDLTRIIPPFRCNEMEKTKLHKEWQIWKRSLEYYFEAEDITDQKRKRAKLLHLGGPQLQALFQSLPNSERFAVVSLEKAYYDVAIQSFDDFFQPGQQDVLERHNLRRMKQQEGERFAEFVIRIRQQISECGVDKFEPSVSKILTDIMLTDTIVEGCVSDELRKQILQKDRSLEEIEEIGKSLEGVQRQLKDFGSTREQLNQHERVYDIQAKRRYQPPNSKTTGDFQLKSKNSEIKCFKCGLFGHISTDTRCPARGKRCKRCNKPGHFEVRCRMQAKAPFSGKAEATDAKRIRVIDHAAQDVQGTRESDAIESSESSTINLPKTYYAFYSGNESNMVTCVIGGVSHQMLVDSGAEANLITDFDWEKLKSSGIEVISCKKGTDRVLKGYANSIPLTVLGTFKAVVWVGTRSVVAEFFVVQGGQRALLGDTTSKRLGILKVGMGIDQVTGNFEPLTKITGVCVHIHLDPNFKPIFQPMRRVPVPLEEAVNDKLKELMARDIIEEKKGPVSWVSPLVVVGKANGEPRICLDLRRVNEAVLRERHPMPVIDDFLARIGPKMIRSKLDVKDSFLQLELDEVSRDAMVFLTARGLYRFKRMPFGLVSAPEVFQKTMDAILAGCEGTWWYIDDVYIEGKDKKEHDERVEKVESFLEQSNVNFFFSY
ncbi:uncharacterized protein K02A2.6-like [Topomyia yanbarensis]|uniref:uncharacterized protein K02A2.6-like n=1 Tax=Topomyia yanbarensis TaxID=2498891 RepID=UPI00273C77C0|nr:uncharacterized protein K02A2.6-like [Topomyia yanbarensis]